ncbi:hypothetical protein Tco_0899774 [Tanacetum coccineum]
MVLNSPCFFEKKELILQTDPAFWRLATPELMATGKETSNPFTVLSMIRFPLLEVMRPVCNFCTYCHGRSGGSKLVAVKTLLGLSLVADLIHCYMFTLLLIHSFKTQQGQAGCLLAVAVAVAVNPPGAEDIDLLLETGQ